MGGKNESKQNYTKSMYKNSYTKGGLRQVLKTRSTHTEKTVWQRLNPGQDLSVFTISFQSQNKEQREAGEVEEKEEKKE